MAPAARAAMRLLSPRLQCLQRKPIINPQQARRVSSRYSSPGKRSTTAGLVHPSGASTRIAQHENTNQATQTIRELEAKIESEEGMRQYHLGRMRVAGMGLALTLSALVVVLYSLDLDEMDREGQKIREGQMVRGGQRLDASDEKNASFQGKEVHIIGAGEGKRIVAQGQGEEIELVETGTSSVPHFPRTIYLPATPSSSPSTSSPSALDTSIVVPAQPNAPANPGNLSNQEQYTLVGLGIRSVSFLSIQVYVAGLYIRTADVSALQARLIHAVNAGASTLIPAEKDTLRARLLDPAGSREVWDGLLRDTGLRTAWRIAPTRGTDFSHLRDGWVTAIGNRTREARQAAHGAETEYDAEDFGRAVGEFKGIFAGGKAPKGSVMILSRGERGNLDVWFQAKPGASGKEKEMQLLGSVADERVGRLIWLGYLAGEKVSSEAARKGVVDGCVAFAGRPVGSVETMVN